MYGYNCILYYISRKLIKLYFNKFQVKGFLKKKSLSVNNTFI